MSSGVYVVSYYAERNDECVDLEIEVEAQSIEDAIVKMRASVRVYSKIFRIERKPLGSGELLTDFEKLNPPRVDGFPKVKEIVPLGEFKTNRNDSNYDKPISDLEKEY